MNDAHSSCGATGPGGGATNGWFPTEPTGFASGDSPGTGGGPAPRRKPRRTAGFALPRPLPWPTILGRAWPGTLIACWTVLTTCVILQPRWSTLVIVGGLLLVADHSPAPQRRAAPAPVDGLRFRRRLYRRVAG